jgi:hypothetical protein
MHIEKTLLEKLPRAARRTGAHIAKLLEPTAD